MRIIAGSAKGRKLISPKGDNVRPTLDSVRESLFNILAPNLEGARLLDIFAGTGALGIEGLSRGAAHCAFVDSSSQSLGIIRQNLTATGFTEKAKLLRLNAPSKLGEVARPGGPFDIIFADPPYTFDKYEKLMAAITDFDLLNEGGIVVIEHAIRGPKIEAPPSLTLSRTEKYGETALSFFS